MYADNSLTPREAIRLCALGILVHETSSSRKSLHYDDLVFSVRHFVSRITGPSLDLMGESIELLRYEGLVECGDSESANPSLKLTETGRATLQMLLRTNLRAGNSELNELIIALKFRFLHLLAPQDQRAQADQFIDVCDSELARLDDLLTHHDTKGGHFTEIPKRGVKKKKKTRRRMKKRRRELKKNLMTKMMRVGKRRMKRRRQLTALLAPQHCTSCQDRN